MKQAVIFDIDGTLLDSSLHDELLYKQAIQDVFGDVRFRAELSDYEDVTDEGIFRAVLTDNALSPEPGALVAVKQRFVEGMAAFVAQHGPFREIPGARKVLARLSRSESHDVAIATGSWRDSARLKLCAAEFRIDGIPLATSDDAVRRTDIMAHALHALSQATGTPVDAWQSVTYYGDGTWDRDACRQLGWVFRAVGPVLQGLHSFDNEYPEQA